MTNPLKLVSVKEMIFNGIVYCARNGITFNRATLNVKTLQADSKFIRTICDHIAGMTDQFAAREYNRLYVPEYK